MPVNPGKRSIGYARSWIKCTHRALTDIVEMKIMGRLRHGMYSPHLGFYPVCPGTDEYVVGAPLFKKATLHLENGNSLIIHATDNNKKNIYIQTMNLNGTEYKKNYLRHEDLLKGGNINFQMGSQPNLNRGTEEESFPYSFSKVLKKIR